MPFDAQSALTRLRELRGRLAAPDEPWALEDLRDATREVCESIGPMVDAARNDALLARDAGVDVRALTHALDLLRAVPAADFTVSPKSKVSINERLERLQAFVDSAKEASRLPSIEFRLRAGLIGDNEFDEVLIAMNGHDTVREQIAELLCAKMALVPDGNALQMLAVYNDETTPTRGSYIQLSPEERQAGLLDPTTPEEARKRCAYYVAVHRPRAERRMKDAGTTQFPADFVGVAQMLSWTSQDPVDIPPAARRAASSISRIAVCCARLFGNGYRASLATALRIDESGYTLAGRGFQDAEFSLRSKPPSSAALVSELVNLVLLANQLGEGHRETPETRPQRTSLASAVDFAVLTALEEERVAVCESLGLGDGHRVRQGARVYWRGALPLPDGSAYEVVVAQAPDMANVDMALLANDTLRDWKPAAAILVGIGASTHAEVHLGDVVVAQDVYYYERGKEVPSGKLLEPKIVSPDATLWSRFCALPRWNGVVPCPRPDGSSTRSNAVHGVIASGEKVIASQAARDDVTSGHRKIRMLDMEGYGFGRAVSQSSDHVRHIVIRAACDDGTPSKDDLWHRYACVAAAAFMTHYLLDRPLEPRGRNASKPPPDPPSPNRTGSPSLERHPTSDPPSGGRPTVRAIRRALDTPERDLEPGTVLGRYRLLEKVGEGAFGDVWKADDTSSDTPAAVKVFARNRFPETSRATAAERFHQGAAAMRRLSDCRRVVRILEGPTVEPDGHIWFSMEFFPARDLARWNDAVDPSPETKLALLADVLAALQAAHAKGILHRDIRPQNILIDTSGKRPRAVLADFDIAYYEDWLRQRSTTTTVLGVARYLPPEVFGAAPASITQVVRRRQNDLYALAVVALDLLAEKPLDLPPEPKKILAALPRRSRGNVRGLSWHLRRELTAFLSHALSTNEATRFPDLKQYARQWYAATHRQPLLYGLPVAAGALLTFIALIVGDWLYYLALDHQNWWPAAAVACFAVAMGSGAGALSWVVALWRPAMPRWRKAATGWLIEHPKSAWICVFVLASLCLGLGALSDLRHRIGVARIVGGPTCITVDSAGRLVRLLKTDDLAELPTVGLEEVRCAKFSGESARIEGLSLLTSVPRLTVQPYPQAQALVSSVNAPARMRISVSGSDVDADLVGVKVFNSNEVDAAPQGLQALVNSGELQFPSFQLVSFRVPFTGVDLIGDGGSITAALVRRGLLDVSLENASDELRQLATVARGSSVGLWADIAKHQHVAEIARQCPDQCCHGTMCKDRGNCLSRAECFMCLDRIQPITWQLELARLELEDRKRWHSVKVCMNVNNACREVCVDEERAGGSLGVFECAYKTGDFSAGDLKVLGAEEPGGPEVRIAEKAFGKITVGSAAFCKGIGITGLVRRKGVVDGVFFSIHPRDEAAR